MRKRERGLDRAREGTDAPGGLSLVRGSCPTNANVVRGAAFLAVRSGRLRRCLTATPGLTALRRIAPKGAAL